MRSLVLLQLVVVAAGLMVQRKDVSLFELQPDKDLLENHTDHMPTSWHVFVDRVSAGNNADDGDACDEQSDESSKVSSGGRGHCGGLGVAGWETARLADRDSKDLSRQNAQDREMGDEE